MAHSLNFRKKIYPSDIENIRCLIESVQVFSPEEIEIAISLADERLSKGIESGYHFLFAEIGGKTIGYTCYGPIPGTKESFDIYWISIHKDFHGLGLGKKLLLKTESLIEQMGGRRIYIETSSRESYKHTRSFYCHCGYKKVAILKDFYSPGDSKIIYLKLMDIP